VSEALKNDANPQRRGFRAWCTDSFAGHILVSLLLIATPLFLIGVLTNVRAGYWAPDLIKIVLVSILVALLPPVMWKLLSNRRAERRERHSIAEVKAHQSSTVRAPKDL
jgi:hypothetical protein